MKEITDAFGNWLAGFTDGEGCFAIHKDNRHSSCAKYRCLFEISLRDDDKAVLFKIRNMLRIGIIYARPVQTSGSCNTRPQTVFYVSAIGDCAKLVKVFSKYSLQAKKQRDFAIWKQAVKELQKPFKRRDADLLEYYFLKIRQVRQYEAQEELPKPKKIELQLSIEF